MTRIISNYEFERRKIVASAKLEITEAMGRVTEKNELTYSEWCLVLSEALARLHQEMVRAEWREDNEE